MLLPLLQAELELRRGTFRERPKLRVATQCYTAYHWLPGALQALMMRAPRGRAGAARGRRGRRRRAAATTIARIWSLCVPPRKARHFTRVPLFKDELVLAVPRGHGSARKKYVEGTDLAEETLIQNNVSSLVRDHVKEGAVRRARRA